MFCTYNVKYDDIKARFFKGKIALLLIVLPLKSADSDSAVL